MGITVCVASGDNGSSDGVSDGGDNVDSRHRALMRSLAAAPACAATGRASPARPCGTTAPQAAPAAAASAAVFPLPAWQNGLDVAAAPGGNEPLKQRGVPDVAGDADPNTGYEVGSTAATPSIGGTSAVAPLWAGLVARINASKGGPVGYINPLLYADGPRRFHDITQGNNGDFAASRRAGTPAPAGLAQRRRAARGAAGARRLTHVGIGGSPRRSSREADRPPRSILPSQRPDGTCDCPAA